MCVQRVSGDGLEIDVAQKKNSRHGVHLVDEITAAASGRR